jgi:transposase
MTTSTPTLATCPGCRQRQREIDGLRAQMAQLQEHIERLQRQLEPQQREQARQAAPFRRRQHAARPKAPGRPQGHAPALRPVPEHIDRVVDVPLPRCPDCHVPLQDKKVVVQYQTDLPPVVPIITQFNVATGYCPHCGQYHQGRHPEQISDAIGAAGNHLGPVVLTMAAELKHRLGVTYRKIADFFDTYFHLKISPATFCRAEQRLAELARPTYDLLCEALRHCGVVHADETGWRIGRVNAWLWVFSSATVTIYAIRTSRGHEVPLEILGDDFDGILVVDGLKSYDVLQCVKGRCNGHLLRRCHALAEGAAPRERPYVEQLTGLLQEAIDLAQRRTTLTAAGYQRRVAALENRLDAWLDHLPGTVSADLDRLANHVAAHRGEWLVFLHEPAVPPTNNHAERMLRPAVITRKVGGCNKTLLGALVHGLLASLMVSCQQQGKRFLSLALQLLRSGQPQAIPLASLPDG